ncbi:MAG: hypothetical protein U0Y82_01205 [Thermoleophilia bacterium]
MPGMNGTQITITALYSAVTLVGIVAMIAVFASTRRAARASGKEANIEKLEKGENYWAIMTVVILVVLFFATYAGIPWLNRAKADSTVQVRAMQFAFVMQPATVKKGTVNFVVRSNDVSHGFGLFDPDNHMAGQIQVEPNMNSTLTVKLTKAGKYTVRCMEFCGFSHHNMVGTFEVTP